MIVNFKGIELDVYFNVEDPDESNGVLGGVTVYKAMYKGVDVLDIILACGMGSYLNEVTDKEYFK